MKQPYDLKLFGVHVFKSALLTALLLLVLAPSALKAQCTFSQNTGFAIVSRDLDDDAAPFNTNIGVSSGALGSIIDVNTPVTISICFWGDMDGANETFDVIIAGHTFNSGNFGTTDVGNPACRQFVITAAEAEANLTDGDIDISYTNFGAGWTNAPAGGDEFNAQIQSISFDFNIPVTLNDPANQCQDGALIDYNGAPADNITPGDVSVYQIAPSPAPGTFNTTTGEFNTAMAPPGVYNIKYIYTFRGCNFEQSVQVEVFPTPVANLRETLLDCRVPESSASLELMFDTGNSAGGTFSIMPAAGLMGSDIIVPTAQATCYNVTYVAPNPNGCPNAPYQETDQLLVTTDPNPAFSIPQTSPICQVGGTATITLNKTSTGPNAMYTITRTQPGFTPVTLPGSTASYNLPAPAGPGSYVYTITLTEMNDAPAACGTTLPGANYTPCSSTVSRTITVYNDGIGCGSSGIDECAPDFAMSDPCPISTSNELQFSCKFFSLPGIQIIEAKLDAQQGIIFCTDEEVCLDWQGSLPGALGDAITGGPTLAELGGAATQAICFIITFEICIPLPIVDDICIDPIPLPQFIEDACDQTIGQFIFSALSALIGGDGGGGYIVADTDGDGVFDIVLEDYDNFPDEGTVCVPNNVTTPQGTITVRHVTGWPFKASSACGVVSSESINLLDILPIGAIPLIGGPIEDLLASAGCGVELVFNDEKTVEIGVINNAPPTFANCNEGGYTFSEDLSCDTEANWSIPVAYDGCYGGNLQYIGRTAATDAFTQYYNGVVPASVVATQSGVYQTVGPLPGSELPPGVYTVTYTAYSCSGVTSTCSFPVTVTAGDPVLACPNNMTIHTDVDVCQAIVTGLTPVSGVGCATVINYDVDYPVVPGFIDFGTSTTYAGNEGTHNDASGTVFPLGVTTVTYTMLVDIDGLNGVSPTAPETQTCTFTVTIEDHQKPVAVCVDQEVRLDNTGNVTVNAVNSTPGVAFVNGGSTDNCDADPVIEIAKPGGMFGPSVSYTCGETGNNFVNLRVTDASGNFSICMANIKVNDFFDGIQLQLDAPEICLEANNPTQLDFSNYLNITLPDGTVITHSQVASNNYLGDAVGGFGISAFAPHPGTGSVDPGTVSTDGVYAPGTGTGFVTVSYVMVLPTVQVPQNGNMALAGCFQIVHETFELRQPLALPPTECECFLEEKRSVNLGTITGGLEPYTIQYSGTILDFNGNFIVDPEDDTDGEYTYDAAHGHNINDFQEFLGYLNVIYTQPTWSFTVVDARGCELFRSGSCDNDDLTVGPSIVCPFPDGVVLTTEEYLCESQFDWTHPLPFDNCAVVLYDYRIYNPDGSVDGPHNLNALLDILDPAPVGGFFDAVYEFQRVNPFGGVSTVYYYAEDAQGNFGTCTFQVTVNDDDPPHFINCPYPPVVQNTESGHCDAYVDFALPLATDNCDIPVVTQIDETGLTTGDRFPAGTTVMYWEAIDLMGNKDTCQVKVIVNDYWQVPAITCPAPVMQDNDLWKCSAVVENIPPIISSPCQDNLAVTYSIYADAALTQRKECGVWDASGEVFDVGMSWVKYTVQNQPLLLITEVAQSTAVDQMEITNLGPSALDITCLVATRDAMNDLADETLPMVSMLPSLAGTVIPVGGTFVFDFAFDGAVSMPACYNISFDGVVLDQVAVNGFANCNGFTGTLAGGDVIRTCEDDSNDAADWVVAENCAPLTIGMLNPTLDAMPDNGKETSLQSVAPTKNSCNFKVTIKDAEDPFCGQLDATTVYPGAGIPNISTTTCNRSTITIPDNGCIIGDIVFDRTGTATPANSTMTLISPYGTKVIITEVPDDSIATLFAEKAAGDWILDIVPNAGQTPTITAWSLTITCIDTFDLADQVIGNDPGQCGANFTWTHPYFVDNCFEGTISVAYTTLDADCTPTGSELLAYFPPENRVKGGYEVTEFFCVGTTTVTYTLTDAAGNVENCSFDVTVEDREDPVVVCPQDITVNLNGGECGRFISYAPASATDNCEVVSIVMDPPSGSYFEIGDHTVTITIYDEAGNSDVCTFQIHVIEYVPTNFSLVCNDLSHVSMDATCEYILGADDALEGDDYHCYEDYIITAKNSQNQIVDNIFDASDIGKTFVVTVLDPETGNTCWTIMVIEDKLAPELTCPANVTVACTEDTGVANTGNVAVVDCSPTPTRLIDDVYTDFGQCATPRAQIVRTFIVRDLYGNQNTCTQTITIMPFTFAELDFPDDVTIDCEDLYNNPGATEPQQTGYPSINGYAIGQGGLCMASINKTDELYDICPGSYEIVRTWRVRNMCLPLGPDNPRVQTQLIKVQDINGPMFPEIADITISTDPSTCCATAPLPDVIISEGCSNIVSLKAKVTGVNELNGDIITFTVNGQLGDFPNNNYWLPDTLAIFPSTQCLPRGTFLVTYTSEDQCGNISSASFNLTVEDYVPPVATCTEFTTVAIGTDDPNDCYGPSDACQFGGVTWVPASAFNQGSYDNCNGVDFTIRRMQEADETYSSCIDGLEPLCDGYEYNLATAENDSIKFYCCEVGTTQTVILRVYQTDLEGNWMTYPDGEYIYNECMINVEVQDKILPACQPPANVTVSCENFEPTLWAYGYPSAYDNCCLDETPPTSADPQGVAGIPSGTTAIPDVCGMTQKTYYNGFLNANFDTTCNRGTIIRRFTAWDCQGQSSSCTQRIVVDYIQDYSITFPADVSVNCVTTPSFGAPIITNDEGCELIGVSYDDVVFTVVPDACYKIERTWTVINWCTYNPDLPCYAVPRNPVNVTTGLAPVKNWRVYLANEINDENCVTYKQIIKVLDQTPPTIACANIDTCDVSTNNVRYWNDGLNWWDNGTMQHDLCEKETDISVTAEDLCDTIAPDGGIRFRYLLFLDLDGDGIMETVVSSADINTRPVGQVLFNNYQSPNYGTGSNWAFDNNSNLNQRYRFDIEQTAGSARVIWRNASGTKLPELAHGRHKIKWIAEDGCGNEAVCEKTFEIKDCKPPVVACANVNINLMVGGMATLWANDFYLYGDDNCTPADVLNSTLAVIRADENPGNTYPGGTPANQSIVVTCEDEGTDVPVQVWLIDAAGNADFCIAYVNVQANVVGCDGTATATVAGTLATENQQGVEEASLELAVVAPTGQQGMVAGSSSSSGEFLFPNAVPMSGDYTLTPTKDDNPLNGVTTYDLVLISKHILGLEPLTTPYKMIAADANRSGSITTFDIVEFRKLILGIYNELPNNTSWRFVDKSYTFPTPSNPFQSVFPENISVQNVQSNQLADDFVGIKVGDVNSTVIANSFQSVDDRTMATMLFDVEDRAVKADETFTVHFKGAERVQGYQFTMNFNGLKVLDVTPGTDMTMENFGVFSDAITTSVDGAANEFTVTFRAAKAGLISSMLGVSSRITKAEAYSATNDRMDVAFRFNSSAGTTISGVGFELYQNQPNPFVNKTFIGFHLPEATSATLRIFDETGRMVFTQNGSFAKGYNNIAVDRALLNTTGMLYYTLETATDSATKKMIQSK